MTTLATTSGHVDGQGHCAAALLSSRGYWVSIASFRTAKWHYGVLSTSLQAPHCLQGSRAPSFTESLSWAKKQKTIRPLENGTSLGPHIMDAAGMLATYDMWLREAY
jgi:hypothetical protein